MRQTAVALFEQAKRCEREAGLGSSIVLYVEAKSLIDQLVREALYLRIILLPNIIHDLYWEYSVCCFRLGAMKNWLFELMFPNNL